MISRCKASFINAKPEDSSENFLFFLRAEFLGWMTWLSVPLGSIYTKPYQLLYHIVSTGIHKCPGSCLWVDEDKTLLVMVINPNFVVGIMITHTGSCVARMIVPTSAQKTAKHALV